MDFLLELILIAVTLVLAYIGGQTLEGRRRQSQPHLLPPEQQLPMPAPRFSKDDDDAEASEDEDEEEDDNTTAAATASASSPTAATAVSFSSPSLSSSLLPPTSASTPNHSNQASPAFIASNKKRRVVIVAKQLPVRTVYANGRWSCSWEDGRNFLSALSVLHTNDQIDVKWVGCPNSNVPIPAGGQEEYEDMLYDYDCIPVFLPPPLYARFYSGFCKSVLWPLLHYVMPRSNEHFGEMWDDHWQAYTAANTLYASVVTHAVETPTDMIWIQNYHLLLLPSFLRTKLPRAKIGLFIHTPFPSSDVFRVLPTRQNILSSMLATDLIGFHTFDYARHFLSCIKRVMDLDFETMAGGALGVKYNGRFVSISISHLGIDSNSFRHWEQSEEVKQLETALRQQLQAVQGMEAATGGGGAGQQQQQLSVVLGVDDYDPVKGVTMKLAAYRHFLSAHPEWRQRIRIVQLIHPPASRQEEAMRERVLHDIAELTALHGDVITVVERELSMAELTAYYAVSHVCIVSTFWDGLNLTPYEFSASQHPEHPGALIISEFMGCSRSLNGVLRVNPWSPQQVSDALVTALSMTEEERRANHQRRFNYVLTHTVERWGLSYLEQLDRATRAQQSLNYVQVGWGSNVKLMGLRSDFAHLEDDAVTAGYRKASKRVLLLDYDGTLTPLEKSSEGSHLIRPTATLKRILRALCDDRDNCVFIMTGRTRAVLTDWFDDLPELGLAAEKGLFLRWPQRYMADNRYDGWTEEEGRREREEAERKKREQQQLLQSAASSAQPDHLLPDGDSLQSTVIDSDWECFPESDTRLLTDAGLLFLNEIEQRISRGRPPLFACYDQLTKALLYRPGVLCFPKKQSATLLSFSSRREETRWSESGGRQSSSSEGDDPHVSLRVTAAHRMFVQLSTEENRSGKDGVPAPVVRPASSLLSRCPTAEQLRATNAKLQRLHRHPKQACLPAVEQDKLGRPCEHRRASLRMLACAERGHVQSEDVKRSLPAVAALGLQTTERWRAFLQLLGFWLHRGRLLYDSRGQPSAIRFDQLQPTDCDWLREQASAAGLAADACRISTWRMETRCRITDSHWCRVFHDEFGYAQRRCAASSLQAHRNEELDSPFCIASRTRSNSGSSEADDGNENICCVGCIDDSQEQACDRDLDAEDDDVSSDNDSCSSLPDWAVMQLAPDELFLLISGLWRADGSRAEQRQQVCTSSVRLREQLVQAMLHCGCSPFASMRCPAGALSNYRWHDQRQDRRLFSVQFVLSLSEEQQRQYSPVRAAADVWAVSWTTPTSDSGAECCWPSLQRQDCIAEHDYCPERDGRLWCVNVQHPDHLIVAQRASRQCGVVTRQSRAVVVGQCLIPLEDMVTWKATALSLIQSYTEQTDGSWIEPKEFAIVWHYENADPEYGRMQAAELQKYLVKLLANPAVDVVKYDYARLLEVKPHGISKGLAANAILESLFMRPRVERSSSAASLSGLQREQTGDNISPVSRMPAQSPAALGQMARAATGSRPTSPGASPSLSSFEYNPPPPFLLCVGDDRSDEEMFLAVNNKEYKKYLVRGGGDLTLRRSLSQQERERDEEKAAAEQKTADGSERSSPAHSPSSLLTARRDEEEEKWGEGDVGRHKPAPDPFTFSVCVGMKPSNAHYYLHDDDEVLKMLLSLATCSQRMQQSRLIDTRQLGELARTYSFNTLTSVLLARTQTAPGSGSNNNLLALAQASSLSLASGQRAALAAAAKGIALSSVAGRGRGGGSSGGFSSRGSTSALSMQRERVSEETADEKGADSDENEYASGSDEEGETVSY